jgi:hypothetical protein
LVGLLICHPAIAETVTPNKLITDTDHIELDDFYCWSDSDAEWVHQYDENACIEKSKGLAFRDSDNNLVVKINKFKETKIFKPSTDAPDYMNACNDGPCNYLFVGYSNKLNSYLIYVEYYEDADFILLSEENLFENKIGYIPIFSKYSKEFIVIDDSDANDRHLLRVFEPIERPNSLYQIKMRLELNFNLNIEFEKWIDENSFSILIWDNPSFKRPDGTVKPGRRL